MKKVTNRSVLSLTELAKIVVARITKDANTEMPLGVSAFTLNGVPVGPNEMSSVDGMLPALVWHADRIAQYGMNRSSGLEPEFFIDQSALLGRSVSLDRFSGVTAEAILFLMESFHQTRETLGKDLENKLSTDLSELVAEFKSCFAPVVQRKAPQMI